MPAALTKAQIELDNPEKSLTGTIEPQGGKDGTRQFRYAPVSSGLDIVSKTLGQHEIATVQITAIDQTSGIVNLTTILAHSSGEWIGSDWPVCPIAETATPHRMGAALTYACRYALFTLVGIRSPSDRCSRSTALCREKIAAVYVDGASKLIDRINDGMNDVGTQRLSIHFAKRLGAGCFDLVWRFFHSSPYIVFASSVDANYSPHSVIVRHDHQITFRIVSTSE